MKILGILFLNFYLIHSVQLFAQDDSDIVKINIDNPNEYLPDYLINIYLGISFQDFINIKDTLFLGKVTSNSPEWFAYREDVNDNYLDHIIYKFDATPDSLNDSLPLFQINIFYTEQEELNNFVIEKFGNPQIEYEDSSAQWILKTNKNFVLIVKKRNNEVKLIATIAGSDWDPNE
ncbi:Hypothetical protein IALB_0168 [Ignavibacterium album JCM 16511]|uniref:Uncharacterized protein n=1 Tax=Ignavibacterium album (strain DSM 19864 / JCM 16511 / NBRC 101810 / Mat9-16) TaxID=945713 RepID=I0AFX3_IGNAJ|nr:hypothetical protein [Ignavibacterium album]AFH47880.1 Hypothetical protein IALB_0168 [Ignavibacterium album JCM 16511]